MKSAAREGALRTMWLSDVHLGSRSCRAGLLLDLLRRTHCELLYLVGDIIDLESLRQRFFWPSSHSEVLQIILRKSREGTRVIYIPGNHDDDLRAFAGMKFGNIEVSREAVHTTRSGQRLLVLHGDQFDGVVRGRSLGVLLGGFACRSLLTLNRFVHWLHDLAGRPYWSLAQHVKSQLSVAKRYVDRFRHATLVAAREAGLDGVICGHIHKAELVELDGLLYCNDGDWVESCTALVENQAGELSLLRWRPSASSVAASAAAPEPVLGCARRPRAEPRAVYAGDVVVPAPSQLVSCPANMSHNSRHLFASGGVAAPRNSGAITRRRAWPATKICARLMQHICGTGH